MNSPKKHRRIARGAARWHAARLEGVVKNRGIKKKKKESGGRKQRLKRVVQVRVSKRST